MERVEIVGVEIDNVSQQEALERVRAMLRSGRPHQIVTPAVEQIIQARRDPEFGQVLKDAELVVADGMPVVFASRWMRAPLKARVTGVDLVPLLCEVARDEGRGVFCFGGEPGVAEETAKTLQQRIPGLEISGTHCPPFGFYDDPGELDKAIHEVRDARPGVLFVALRSPRMEKWIHQYKDRLGVPVMIGIGGAFNFIIGRETRAPQWIQDLGLEFAWRLSQRPGEIWKRLIRNAPYFIWFYFDLLTYRVQKRVTQWVRPLLLALVDAGVATASFIGAYWLYFRVIEPGADPYPGRALLDMPGYSDLLSLVALAGAAAPFVCKLDQRDKYLEIPSIAWRCVKAAGLSVIALIGFQFAFKGLFQDYQLEGFSRVVFALFGAGYLAALTGWRLLFRSLEHFLHRRGLSLDRILIVGQNDTARQLAQAMRERPELGNRPLGFVLSGHEEARESDIPIVGRVSDLKRLVPARKIDEILVADPGLPHDELAETLRVCREHRVSLSIVPTLHEWLGVSSEVKRIGDARVITVALDAAYPASPSSDEDAQQ